MPDSFPRSLLHRRELLLAAGVLLLIGPRAFAAAPARRLKLKNQNTGETFSGAYRDNAGPIPDAIEDLVQLLRDHHAGKTGPVDMAVIDFMADVMTAAGQGSATILSAFRTPETNDKLKARGFSPAEKSQHLVGHAVDISLERNLAQAKDAARAMRRGGVGWYPRSHFIHLDTGPVRNWDMGERGLDSMLTGRGGPSRYAPGERQAERVPERVIEPGGPNFNDPLQQYREIIRRPERPLAEPRLDLARKGGA